MRIYICKILTPVLVCVILSACSSYQKVQHTQKAPPVHRTPAASSKYSSNTYIDKGETAKPRKFVPGSGGNGTLANDRKGIKERNYAKIVPVKPQSNARNPLEGEFYKIPATINESEKYDKTAQWEKDFHDTQIASGRKFLHKKIAVPVPGEDKIMEVVRCTPANGYTGYYEAEVVDKKQIVMHFTVGNIKSDVDVLTRPRRGYSKYRESVPFVLGRDGTIYQLFSSSYWSHHLGKGTIGGNEEMSKQSIAIEISNYGPLLPRNGKLETVYSRTKTNPNYVDVYCSMEDSTKYIKLDKPYKGYQYYANFTHQQYETLIVLLRYLTATYDIPREFLPEDIRFDATEKNTTFKGVLTHLNYRATGKWDIGPAFDWERVIRGVQAEKYEPHFADVGEE
ncbi:MAG: N-acetylmuramoyl-L-alanine amidase [Chitinophagales bacterium]